MILVEPEALLTASSKLPGTEGRDVQVYDNTISLREDAESVRKKIRAMPTDPGAGQAKRPGNPDKCPVWQFHLVYSDEKTRQWANQGCRTAGIGCLYCKQPVIEAVLAEQGPMKERAPEVPGRPDTGAQHRRRRLRKSAQARERDDARCPRSDGAGLHMSEPVRSPSRQLAHSWQKCAASP